MKEFRSITKRIIAVILATCLISALTACRGDNTTGSDGAENTSINSTASGAPDADKAAVLEKLEKELAPYRGKPQFTEASLEKVDAASVMEGKKIFIIPYDPTNLFSSNIAKNEEIILKALGAEPFVYEGENSADGWSKGIQMAIAQKYDIVDLVGGADVTLIEPAIAAAQKAGIIVMDSHGADIKDKFTDDYTVGADYYKSAALQMYYALDYAQKNLGGFEKLDMLIVGCTGLPCDITVKKGFDDLTAEYSKYGCKFTLKQIPSTEWDTKTQEEVQSALTADPNINFICSYYDNQLLRVLPALEQMGKTDIPTISYNGSPNVLDYVKSGQINMDIGESVRWMAYHCIDCMIRALDKKEVPNNAGYAMYFITKDNIDNCLNPETKKADYAHDGVEDVYNKGYADLWNFDVSKIDFSKIK